MITYDDLLPIKKLHFTIKWALIAIIYFLFEELIFLLVGENVYFEARLLLTVLFIAGVPITLTYFYRAFPEVIDNISSIVQLQNGSNAARDERYSKSIFSFRNRQLLIWVVITYIVVLAIVFTVNLPFKTPTILAIVFLLIPLSVVGSHAAYIVYGLNKFLFTIADAPIILPFYKPGKIVINKMQRYYTRMAFAILSLYLAHYLSFILSGYADTLQITTWMIVIGMFPLSLFLLSFFQIRKLLTRIKQHYIELIGDEIQTSLIRFQKSPSSENTEILEKLMTIQAEVAGMRDWPTEFESIVTFLLALLAPIAQLVFILFEDFSN